MKRSNFTFFFKLDLRAEGKIPFLRLKLKIWTRGVLISSWTAFKSFIEMPSMSVLTFDFDILMMSSQISPGLIVPRSKLFELFGIR